MVTVEGGRMVPRKKSDENQEAMKNENLPNSEHIQQMKQGGLE